LSALELSAPGRWVRASPRYRRRPEPTWWFSSPPRSWPPRARPGSRHRWSGPSATKLSELADRQLTIEAIVENEAVKAKVFAELDEVITDPDAVLASNTSSIPIMKIAAATKNPGRVLGLHFFNPVPVLPLVELISTLVTAEEAVARVEHFASEVLGKKVVRCGDRSGFVVNALLVPYLLSAIRMVESGVASVEDVDTAIVAGLSHPMGPLRLSDLIGLDTMKLIADAMYDELKDAHYAPPPLLQRMVEAGQLGKKSGKGFYAY
jgi:3-hydroxybutyryl-CoA dehydrogenase